MLWRRSYGVPPPPIEPDSEFSQDGDPRYADLGAEMPATECLADVVARFLPVLGVRDRARPPRRRQAVLLAAHGNSLRALVKHLDDISDEAIAGLNIPTGIPLRYDLDDDLRPTVAGRHLPRPGGREGRHRRGRRTGTLTGPRRCPVNDV